VKLVKRWKLNREKQLKGWTRAKKMALIESVNPAWKDLSLKLIDQPNDNEITKKTVIKHGVVNEFRKWGHV
jgi:hypothetical protein